MSEERKIHKLTHTRIYYLKNKVVPKIPNHHLYVLANFKFFSICIFLQTDIFASFFLARSAFTSGFLFWENILVVLYASFQLNFYKLNLNTKKKSHRKYTTVNVKIS